MSDVLPRDNFLLDFRLVIGVTYPTFEKISAFIELFLLGVIGSFASEQYNIVVDDNKISPPSDSCDLSNEEKIGYL